MTIHELGLIGAVLLIILGIYCLATKRNMIKLILGVEIMTNGAIMALVTFAVDGGGLDPVALSIAIMAIGIGGCIAAVGLAIIVQAYRHYKTLDVRELRRLRW